MATLTVSGNNASYKLSLSGMSTSTRYHVFVADLSSSGTVTGYKCVRSSLGTSSTWTYSGSSNSPYSNYSRSVYVYTSTAATSHSVGTIYTYDEMRNGCTFMDSDTIPAAGSSTSYKVKVVLGTGISQVSYGINTDSLTTGPVGSDFTADVKRKSGYVYIGISRIASGYTYPVTATDGSSTWTVINANGTYSDHYISAPSSGGTRTVTLTATKDTRRYYQVHAFANGGKFSDGTTDYYTDLAASATVSVDFDLSTLKTPSRGGYTFKGWGYSSNATQYYTGTIPISATSQDSNDPTIYNLYAIWVKTEYTCYIKIGAGINSASVYVDGALKSDIRDKVYHAITVNYDSTITVSSIAKAAGYARPYIFKFYQTSTSTTPTSTLERDTDTPSYTYSTSRFYAEIVATKSAIDLFYWVNEASDDTLIAKGEPVKNITAARWNSLKAKIKELADAQGISYTYSNVSSGSTFSATEFNAVRNVIDKFDGAGALPPIKNSGDQILASFFNGTASLKSALNRAITTYNNS